MSEKMGCFTVKEASNILGVTPVTVRRWDNAENLKSKRHPMNNDRIYDPVEFEALKKAILKGETT